MKNRLLFYLLFFISTSCSSSKKVDYIAKGNWCDLFANQSGYDLTLEIVKKSYNSFRITEKDSTKIRITPVNQVRNGSLLLTNPDEDGITSTGNLDISVDGSTKILIIPKGYKVVAISSQKKCYFILTLGYFFSKKSIKIR